MSTIEKHDMTQGKILLPLVSFTIPLVLGNLFQLTYNAADSVIVGKYVGEHVFSYDHGVRSVVGQLKQIAQYQGNRKRY